MNHRILAIAALAGCSDELPSPPDISELERAYAAPTATVADPAELGTLANAVTAINDALGRGEVVIDSTGGVLDDPDVDASDAPLPFDLRGTGIARIRHVCPGVADQERSAEVTGQIDLSVRFELGKLEPVLWGLADRCAFAAADRNIVIDGDLVIARIDRGILFALTGALAVDDEVILDGDVDFVVHAGGVDYRQQLGDGHVILTLGRDGRIVVHAADGDHAVGGQP